jgi:hypothetical protein
MLAVLSGLLEKFGARLAGVVILGSGVIEILPTFGVSEHAAHGIGLTGVGLAIIVFGKKWESTDTRYVASEAEKRLLSTDLPSKSVVPVIQREIDNQRRQSQDGGRA